MTLFHLLAIFCPAHHPALPGLALLFLLFFMTLPVYGEVCSTETDGDGWLDGAEKAAGSDPLSQISTPINP
jgi:hypothetical protein